MKPFLLASILLLGSASSCAEMREEYAAYDFGAAWVWLRAFTYAKVKLGYPHIRAKGYAVGRADLHYGDVKAQTFSKIVEEFFVYATDSLNYETTKAESYSLSAAQAQMKAFKE